jgi:hypothetical protein
MVYNFLRGDRDQPFLLPPDLRDWLPDGLWGAEILIHHAATS